MDYEGLSEITWKDLIERTTPTIGGKSISWRIKKSGNIPWDLLKKELIKLTSTAAEKYFMKGYLEVTDTHLMTLEDISSLHFLDMPALIPQAWINWIHYDSSDKERTEKIKREPQRVDFLMYYKQRWIIIEIDGTSHFSEIVDIDGKTGKVKLEGSLEKYTEHLKKDRWLRTKGYEVWRYSDLEIMEIEKRKETYLKTGDGWPCPGGYIYEYFLEMGLNLNVVG